LRAAQAGPELLANCSSPHAALAQWVDLFVDFLITKHGIAAALRTDNARFEPGVDLLELLYAVGNLCVGGGDARYDARRMVELLVAASRSPRRSWRVAGSPDGSSYRR